MLTELERPDRLIGYSDPVLAPKEPYEQSGVYSRCVFSNGVLAHKDGRLTVFYGGADTVTCAAETTIDEMIATVQNRR